MKRIATWITSGAWVVGMSVLFAGNVAGQDLFPDGQGRETLFVVCIQCHSLSRITDAKLSASDWEFTVYDMISRGAPVHDDEIAALKQYLVDNFATDSKQAAHD